MICICSGFYILFLFSIVGLLVGEFIISIVILLISIGFFLILIISSIKKERAYLYNSIGILLILIGFLLYFIQLLFDNDIKNRLCGSIFVIICSIFIGMVLFFLKISKNVQKKKEGSKICESCNGSGKVLGFIKCPWCDGTGIDKRKADERPMICYFCANRGTCNRCKGSKYQKKYLLFGSKIICKKCVGTGICPICKDAPNGGYYITWYLNDDARVSGYKPIRQTNSKIKELTNVWENLRLNNTEIKRFEDFIRLPSYNEQEKIPSDEPSMLLYHLIEAEMERYEQYLGKFM